VHRFVAGLGDRYEVEVSASYDEAARLVADRLGFAAEDAERIEAVVCVPTSPRNRRSRRLWPSSTWVR
jgi:hypothetical protein